MMLQEPILLDPFGRQRKDMPGLGLAFDRDEVEFDQRGVAQAGRGFLADDQVHALELAQTLKP
jgi:hypothetical protein